MPPPDPPELPEGADPRPRWPWWSGIVAFFAALVSAFALGAIFGLIAVAAGADLEDPGAAVNIVGTLIQDVVFVGAALAFASMTLRPRAWHFGFRRARFWPALGWCALGFVVFFLFSIFYTAALGLDEEQTTLDDLGADEGTIALIASALLVIVVAPIVEEFFFRGFLYRTLRTSLPAWVAILIAGGVFGLIHAPTGIEAVPSIFVLGVVLCFIYERTGSLYPVIALHAFNNMIAFLVGTEAFALSLVLGFGTIVVCVLLPRLARQRVPAIP